MPLAVDTSYFCSWFLDNSLLTHPYSLIWLLALITQVDDKIFAATNEKSGGYDEQACLQAFDAVTTGLAMFATRSSENKQGLSVHFK